MSYFNPSRPLYNRQTDNILKYAGQTAIWRQMVSADEPIDEAGFSTTPQYREQIITAVFGGGWLGGGVTTVNLQRQLAMGQLAAGQIRVTTQEKLSQDDEFIWNGVRYRVDTDSQLSPLNHYYMSILTRGDN